MLLLFPEGCSCCHFRSCGHFLMVTRNHYEMVSKARTFSALAAYLVVVISDFFVKVQDKKFIFIHSLIHFFPPSSLANHIFLSGAEN
jgi:hypothetical protein